MGRKKKGASHKGVDSQKETEGVIARGESSGERRGWRKGVPRLTRRQWLFIGIVLILLAAAFVTYKVYEVISQDLIIILDPATEALRLNHGERGTATFSLHTNNYLFCEAECSYKLRDLSSGQVVAERKGILLQNNNVTLPFAFQAPEKGEGQLLYSLAVTCANRKNALCGRTEREHLATTLITIDYALTSEEAKERAAAQKILERFLTTLREADLLASSTKEEVAALNEGGDISLDGLENESETMIAMVNAGKEEAARLSAYWQAEEYEVLTAQQPLQAEAAFLAANETKKRVAAYVASQHLLIQMLRDELGKMEMYDEAYRLLALHGDDRAAILKAGATDLAKFAKAVAAKPGESVFSRLRELQSVRNGLTSELNSSETLVAAKKAIVEMSIEAEVTRLNLTRNKEAGFAAQCEELQNVLKEIVAANLTPVNRSAEAETLCENFLNMTGLKAPSLLLTELTLPAVNLTSDVETTVTQKKPVCCLNQRCLSCCDDAACRPKYPILFLHGHSMNSRNAPEYTIEGFAKIQRRLQEDGLFIDAGILTPYASYVPLPDGVWGRSSLPVMTSGTYYYDAYLSGSSYILSVTKSESIDTYALRTKELVETLRQRTGSDKVIIVAHSMGGLVARRYAQLFPEYVAGIVMLGTPNNGIDDSIALLCPFVGANKECNEMRMGSLFLAKVNDPARQPQIPMSVIIGSGCEMSGKQGDGVVLIESATLRGATNIMKNGSCSGASLLHTDMLDPDKYPELYAILRGLLEEQH